MRLYLNSIETSLYLFPLIALMITVPFLIYQYRKYGGIPIVKCFLFFSFILYLTCCYGLVIFPLPTAEELASISGPSMDLRVFGFLDDIKTYSSFVLSDSSTWKSALSESWLYDPIFNFLMLIPFGIYMHYYFRKSWITSIFLGFLLSLSFELIQLTAIFGLIEKPYRLFQIDDLILNTFGAAVGWLISPLLTWVLPNREKIDEISYAKGMTVVPLRRLMAILIDLFLFVLFGSILSSVTGITAFSFFHKSRFIKRVAAYIIEAFLYFGLLTWILGGSTPGKHLLKLRLTGPNYQKPTFRQLLVRYTLEILLILPCPAFSYQIFEFTSERSGFFPLLLNIVALVCLLFFTVSLFEIFMSTFTGRIYLFSEKISATQVVSTQKMDSISQKTKHH